MQLLNEILIERAAQATAHIQLLQGDLTAIPNDHATDILIISAYPGSYIPVPGTLIAALDGKGINIEEMARHKAIDLRDQLGCWLSEPLSKDQQLQLNIKRILCFEPWHQSNDQSLLVGNIFRCINTFAFNENNNVIAMPVLASGQQSVPFEKMLPAMLDASIFWMENGLPLHCIKLVVFSEQQAKAALPVFTRARQQNELKQSLRNGHITGATALKMMQASKQEQLPGEAPMQIVTSEINQLAQQQRQSRNVPGAIPTEAPKQSAPDNTFFIPPRPVMAAAPDIPEKSNSAETDHSVAPGNATPAMKYDYFVSYAHTHAAIIDAFVQNLLAADNNLHVFYDKDSIPQGGLWLKQISDAIQQSDKILIFLSPEYSSSPVCWDEFQCAKLMEYNRKKQLIQTVYLYNDAAMPPIMGIYSWTDCREGDAGKLQQMATQLISNLEASKPTVASQQ